MRHVTIDALPILLEGGISNYIRPLVEHVRTAAGPSWSVEMLFRLGPYPSRLRRYRQWKRSALPESAGRRLVLLPDRLVRGLWERGLPVGAFGQKGKRNVFLATTELFPRSMDIAVGWIVYDLVPLRIPQYFPGFEETYRREMTEKASRCEFIVAISECTRKDIVELLGYPEEKICVVYPGFTAPRVDISGSGGNSRQRPYIYYLGALSLNKNVDGMLRIFARCVHEHGLDLDIVLTGKDFCGREFWDRLARDLRIMDRVRITGWVSETQREVLLSQASMLWQFSWYEGFGLPVLEAAGRGIPVLCSNRGSVPEILCNPEQEIDPADEEQAAHRAAGALRSEDTLGRWGTLGKQRATAFRWESTAKKLFRFVEEITR
jgi:glycosyltransferase involved in cell wall biosynthesis